jgi:23S rRNA (guanosine2251-2'-O)-methyltransferase
MQEEYKQELVYGLRPVIEAIGSGKEMEKVLVQKGLKSENFGELMAMIKAHEVPVQFVPYEKLKRVTRKNHQGVIAYVSPITFYNIEDVLPSVYEAGKMPFILIMDRITDVRNFGAILRSAEAAGIDAVVFPARNSAQLNSGTVKSSAGAIFKVPICRSDNLKTTIDFLKESGLKIVAASEKAVNDYFNSELSGPLALILGSEGEGVSPEYLKRSDVLIKIPMLGEIESLNVSVAAGVLMYEVVRQRQLEEG